MVTPDVVYSCRAGANEELRYSLRTLDNLRHGRVWVAGGGPMRRAGEILVRWGFDRPLSYELHVLLVNKAALAAVITRALDESEPPLHTRTLYGNSCRIGGVEMPDCKITDKHAVPDPEAVWVSTADATFRAGAVGRWIRARFSHPSRYER